MRTHSSSAPRPRRANVLLLPLLVLLAAACASSPEPAPQAASEHEGHATGQMDHGEHAGHPMPREDEPANVYLDVTGHLLVSAFHNGELGDATVQVYQTGTRHLSGHGRTGTDAADNPLSFELPGGTYDVEIRSVDVAGRPMETITAIMVEPEARTHTSHDFASGELQVGVFAGQQRADAVIAIYPAGSDTEVARSRSRTGPPGNPSSFRVAPGAYRVVVLPVPLDDETAHEVEVTVPAGGLAESKVQIDTD